MENFQTANSRFLYLETHFPERELSRILKDLFLFLDQKKDVEAYGDSIYAYFNLSDPAGENTPWKIGKEITGYPGAELPYGIQFEDLSATHAKRFQLPLTEDLSFKLVLEELDKLMEQKQVTEQVRYSRLRFSILGAGYTNTVYLELLLGDSV